MAISLLAAAVYFLIGSTLRLLLRQRGVKVILLGDGVLALLFIYVLAYGGVATHHEETVPPNNIATDRAICGPLSMVAPCGG
jgi:hypothetical protein